MEHPIKPPPELVVQWYLAAKAMPVDQWVTDVATAAARWGGDQELEACCEWLDSQHHSTTWSSRIRADRRPQPPSLKEQALGAMGRFTVNAHTNADEMNRDFDTIRRALVQLND